ncbi:pickpocket protein 28-like [Thrips palmi]|uniref:Pickpocket protein 28-like n=1 Tax=Thrips palmi TaxID=161013 RepID=A0A6P9AEX3_THRPL|nr:pickpocket protein 28-like [Thrips palmi]
MALEDAEDSGNRRPSVFDSSSRPPRNSTRESLRRGRTPFKTKTKRSALQQCWDAYCTTSGLHGVSYFVGDDKSRFERVLWMVCVVLCFGLSGLQIYEVYARWDSSPPILSISSSTPARDVPFPAVSICPRNTSSKFGLSLCGRGLAPKDCLRKLILATPPLKELVQDLSWNGVSLDGGAMARVLADDGFCYTFNMMDPADIFTEAAEQHVKASSRVPAVHWSLEGGYTAQSSWTTFPRRAMGSTIRSGLYMTLRGKGLVKVVLHTPLDLPIVTLSSDYVFRTKETKPHVNSPQLATFFPFPGEEAVVTVTPTMTAASYTLLGIAPETRNCYFPTERRLAFFTVYTQRNCELECLANMTARVCGCAAIYMPRSKHQSVCQSRACYETVTKGDDHADCGCLPECSSIGYDSRVSHYSWQREHDRVDAQTDGLDQWTGLSRISIQIKDTTFTAVERSHLYSRPEFLADVGGLLGIFSGFSIISIVEVVFHMLIQWFCYVFK